MANSAPATSDSRAAAAAGEARVLRVDALPDGALAALLRSHGLTLETVAEGQAIPGSYWGEREAGLIGTRLLVRADTPVHSALHEAAHFICMDDERRAALHFRTDGDAGGTDTEEHAVCYLQALLAGRLPGYSRARLFSDMDDWGYHFIRGSARAWFESDADDAIDWLRKRGLLESFDP